MNKTIGIQNGYPVKVVKTLLLKVWSPEGKLRQTRVKSPEGAGFNAQGIEQCLGAVAKQINQAWPEEVYDVVMIDSSQYNFVHRGKKPVRRILDEYENRPSFSSGIV